MGNSYSSYALSLFHLYYEYKYTLNTERKLTIFSYEDDLLILNVVISSEFDKIYPNNLNLKITSSNNNTYVILLIEVFFCIISYYVWIYIIKEKEILI